MEDGTDGRIAGGGREGGKSKERVEMVRLLVSYSGDQKRVEPTTPESPSQTSKSNFERTDPSLFIAQIRFRPRLCNILLILFSFSFKMRKQIGMRLSPVPNCRNITWRLPDKLQGTR